MPRYIKRDVLVDAFQITSVGPETVAAVSQPALTECTLQNGDKVQLHAGHTGFAAPQVGDYYLTDGTFVQKAAFEKVYAREYYGASDGSDSFEIT